MFECILCGREIYFKQDVYLKLHLTCDCGFDSEKLKQPTEIVVIKRKNYGKTYQTNQTTY